MEGFSGNSGVGGERGRAGGRWLLFLFLLFPFCLKWDIIPSLHMFDTC